MGSAAAPPPPPEPEAGPTRRTVGPASAATQAPAHAGDRHDRQVVLSNRFAEHCLNARPGADEFGQALKDFGQALKESVGRCRGHSLAVLVHGIGLLGRHCRLLES